LSNATRYPTPSVVANYNKTTINIYQNCLSCNLLKTVPELNMTDFWYIAPCSLVEVDRRFRGANCSHHKGPKVAEVLHFSNNPCKLCKAQCSLVPRFNIQQLCIFSSECIYGLHTVFRINRVYVLKDNSQIDLCNGGV
jgi:hypothetical protein